MQVDTLHVFHANSPSNDIGVLTDSTLTGLGMGGDVVISGRTLAGGITYSDLEVLKIDLGSGNDSFTIESTHSGSTVINSGKGSDTINVKTVAGHTTINTGADADTISVRSADLLVDSVNALLTINGGGDIGVVETLDQIASALRQDINSRLGAATATGSGAVLQLASSSAFTVEFEIRRIGSSSGAAAITPESAKSTPSTSATLTLSGTPVEDEIWTVRITLGGVTYTFRHLVTATTAGDVLNVDDRNEAEWQPRHFDRQHADGSRHADGVGDSNDLRAGGRRHLQAAHP